MPLVPWNWNQPMIPLLGRARWCCPVQMGMPTGITRKKQKFLLREAGTVILNNDYMPVVPTVVHDSRNSTELEYR